MLYNTFKYTLEFHFLLIAMQKIIARVSLRREALGFFFFKQEVSSPLIYHS